jgi:hypothetical protein
LAAAGALVGAGVGLGVGFGVGLGVARGVGCAVWVARGVASGVWAGAVVGPLVELGWLGAGVVNGPWVGWPGMTGELLATAIEGLGTAGLGLVRPVGAVLGEAVSPGDALALAGTPVGVDAGTPVDGVGVETWAIWPGCPERWARCWSSAPPMPSATVARTRFRTPRLRMRRAR